jgi:hypothetical protein
LTEFKFVQIPLNIENFIENLLQEPGLKKINKEEPLFFFKDSLEEEHIKI